MNEESEIFVGSVISIDWNLTITNANRQLASSFPPTFSKNAAVRCESPTIHYVEMDCQDLGSHLW